MGYKEENAQLGGKKCPTGKKMFPVGEKFFSSWKPLIGVFYENRAFGGEKATDKRFAVH